MNESELRDKLNSVYKSKLNNYEDKMNKIIKEEIFEDK